MFDDFEGKLDGGHFRCADVHLRIFASLIGFRESPTWRYRYDVDAFGLIVGYSSSRAVEGLLFGRLDDTCLALFCGENNSRLVNVRSRSSVFLQLSATETRLMKMPLRLKKLGLTDSSSSVIIFEQ